MKFYFLCFLILASLIGCATVSEDALYSAMKKNPEKFMQTLNEVAEMAAKKNAEKFNKSLEQQREKDLQNPRPVKVDDSRLIFGEKNAPVVIVKYADFQCPACRMGYLTLEEVKKKYKGKIKVIHKNIPLPMHAQAVLAAEIYEATLIKDKELAKKFYSEAYEKLGQWNTDEKLWKLAKSVGIKKEKVLAELKKGVVAQRLKEDLEEHQLLGFRGTPMYMVNGVEIQGAPSFNDLSQLIDKVLSKKQN